MPREVTIQLQMQSLGLKVTDLWGYLALPSKHVDNWIIVAGCVREYQEAMQDDG